LCFLLPDHIFSWTAQENIKGLSLYFKKSFLDFYSGTFEFDFSFFNLSEHNILELPQSTITAVSEEFEHILREYRASNPYRIDILKPLLLSLLFKCKSIIEEACLPELNHSQLLWHKFKNLLHNLYITHKQVSDYANQLNVSPYTLNKTVKELTGKSPKEIITDKILEESKKMLAYTVCDVSEIAYALGFPEPTHFVRFFKNQTQQTPNQYRSLLF